MAYGLGDLFLGAHLAPPPSAHGWPPAFDPPLRASLGGGPITAHGTLLAFEARSGLSLRRSHERLLLVRAEHSRIVEAIRAEDAEGARAAMRAHIEAARARVLTDRTEP